MIILSILCPTTPDRVDLFAPLYNELQRQLTYMQTFHPTLGEIEILVDESKRFLDGGLSIGKKREALVKRAKGKFLCFVDSDDWIAPNYMETLVRLAQEDKDIITFLSLCKNESHWSIVTMRRWYKNEESNPLKKVKRSPWPVCPVKSEYAKQHDFPDTNYAEDWEWMQKVLQNCKTESHSYMILHEYRHGQHSESDKIIKAGYV